LAALQSERRVSIEVEVSRRLAPRNALEFQLTRIWEDLLGRDAISVDEDFFALGGDSILAMSLLARIVQETGHKLPTSGILQAPTIERLARALRDTSEQPWTPLVPIQANGTKPPFFCVHPSGGNVLCYMRLASLLGADQPFYGFECAGIDSRREPLDSAEAMASEYVAALREVQPHGPYFLGGWSVGGVLAYEMAVQLRELGEPVGLLALIDSGVLYACALLTALFSKGETGILDILRMRSSDQLSEFRERSAAARLIPNEADEELATRIMHLFVANMMAVMNYRPRPFDGTVTLFQAAEAIVKPRFAPGREWGRSLTDLEIIEVPGSHLTMVQDPHVKALAQQLRRSLDIAQAAAKR
jgi:pyochelin synthetase